MKSKHLQPEHDANDRGCRCEPKELAKLRGEAMKSFLVRPGMNPQDVWVQERIIQGKEGKPDPDDMHQVGVEFVPKCPPEGCQSLCNTPGLQGVVSYAVTPATPGPLPDGNRFTCADKREPATARIVTTERWTRAPKIKRCSLGLPRSHSRTFATESPRAPPVMSG
ncbi:hypothetical protein [Burkholderia ubonensis]|uniref:hypothetical protein n=1 Tax=Burkholderia ubonensis TaxID=101571 RepID=UPI0018E1D90D|nr:hypothetical protein [Burkholderia ubonensis]